MTPATRKAYADRVLLGDLRAEWTTLIKHPLHEYYSGRTWRDYTAAEEQAYIGRRLRELRRLDLLEMVA